ncbi:MAG: hypothetical protein MI924_11020 [Chloroflexales bacterium]|nr:hypothetical protein [Chloroflexales bacterium]
MALSTLIDATDLTSWSGRHDAQRRLPQLVRRLIHATVSRIVRIGFPAGEGVQLGGWDGIVTVEQGNAFVLAGHSVWELGVNRSIKGKADSDYEKRKADPLDLDPAATTFIFVTPRRWGGKDAWIAQRQGEGFWREVRAYDADDLEQWLELAPSVHIWLSITLGKYPETAIDLGGFWADWSEATRPALSPSFLTNGRNEQIAGIQSWLRGEPAGLSLKADSRDEAIAFFAAILHQLSEAERLPVLSRSIIVDDLVAWRQLSSANNALLLIPRFNVGDALAQAFRGGHHVLIPLGRDDSESAATVLLPRLRRNDVQQALIGMGLNEDQADDLATLARRNLMALRRKLAINRETQQPLWAKPSVARDLIPALLVGGWHDSQPGDRAVIANLARMPYEDVSVHLVRWAHEPDPPVRRIGDTWLLTSKEDAWTLLARFLSCDDRERFASVVLEVLGAIDPQFELPNDQRWMAGVLGHAPLYSGLLRQGLADTLALMGARSDSTQFTDAGSGQEHANAIVHRLLRQANEDWRHWASLSGLLQSLAEAAPDEFLAAVERGLTGDQPVLAKLFVDSDHPFFVSSPHTGLLWAIELLAWHPDYLPRATLLLAQLAARDPGGKLLNRPENSLREIFLFWHPQTTARLTQRLGALDLIRKREPPVAWNLMCRLLPESHSIATPTAAPKWREWASEEQPQVTYAELFEAACAIVERLLADVGDDAQRWQDLIEHIDDVPQEQRDAIVKRLEAIDLDTLPRETGLAIREALRVMITRHREIPDANWVMPKEIITRLDGVYKRFEPSDLIDKYAWLFSNNSKLMEPFGHDWQARQRAMGRARMDAAAQVYKQGGLRLLLMMVDSVEQPGELGMTLGNDALLATEETQLLHECLGTEESIHSAFIRGYVTARSRVAGWQWIEEMVAGSGRADLSSPQQSEFFLCLPFESHSWDLLSGMPIETQRLYWRQAGPWGCSAIDCLRAVTLFLEHDRPYAALVLIALGRCEAAVSPEIIADVLDGIIQSTPEYSLDVHSLGYHISESLDLLEASGSAPEERIAALEWSLLPLLEHQSRGPKILHRELARNPNFFVEILTLIYRAEHDEPSEQSDQDQLRARVAYDLLRTWRTVPGTQEDGSLDASVLQSWMQDARASAQARGREKVGDRCIGEILACGPKDPDGSWPAEAVRDVIDAIGSKMIDRGFMLRVYNTRGMIHKAIAEGGIQEQQLAATYHGYADMVKERWPRTAALLKRIADGYASEARHEDIRAELEEDLWP